MLLRHLHFVFSLIIIFIGFYTFLPSEVSAQQMCSASICSTASIEQNPTIGDWSQCQAGSTELGPLGCDYGAFFRPLCGQYPDGCYVSGRDICEMKQEVRSGQGPSCEDMGWSGDAYAISVNQSMTSWRTQAPLGECVTTNAAGTMMIERRVAISCGGSVGGNTCTADMSQVAVQNAINECRSTFTGNVTHVLRDGDTYTVCHDNQFIDPQVCSGGHQSGWQGHPICSGSFPLCTLPPSTPTGSIFGNNCTIASGQSVCTVNISWSVANVSNGSVRINGQTFAGGISGSGNQAAPWIGVGPGTFTLHSGPDGSGTQLSSVTVVGVCTAGTVWNGSVCEAVPPPPTGLSATPSSCGTGQNTITWNPVPGAWGYDLWINGIGWFNVGNVTSFAHTGLAPNEYREYFVRAWNGAGHGSHAGPVGASGPNVCLPAQPDWIAGSCPAPGDAATMWWPAVPGATWYAFRADNWNNGWNGSCDPSTTFGDFCGGVGNTWITMQGIPGSSINTWVHACNGAGCSAPSPNTVFSCGTAAPSNLTATPQACGTNQLFLDWDDVPGATSYSIYYSNGTWIGNSLGSNFTFTGGTNLSYAFFVRANSGAGQSANSAVFGGTTPAPCPTFPDLKINGSDGPISVNYGAWENLTWTSTGAAPTCTLSGAGIPSGTQIVASSGNTWINVLQSSLYSLTCGTEIDTLQVNLNPQPPNAPTINFPAGNTNGVAGTPVQFRIVSTHPNPTSQFYYTIDWDNNNSPDGPSPSPTYISGQQWTIDNTWLTNGTFTVRACARDVANALPAACTNHTVTITLPPPPSVTLQYSVNGGVWTAGDITINPSDTLSLRWESFGAQSCTATAGPDFSTGTTNPTSGTDAVVPPAPATTAIYTVSCTGFGGTTQRSVSVTARNHPNFTQPNILFVPSGGFDPVTGIYDFIDVTFQTRNDGESSTLNTATYEFQFDRGRDGYEYTTTGSINAPFPAGGVFNRTERVSGVPFGNARTRVAIDTPLPNGVVTEINENDNVWTFDFTVSPPDPDLSLFANPIVIRNGQFVELRWNTVAMYPLQCRIEGPGISVNDTVAPYNGMQTIGPINAKSTYNFTCVEPITNTTWTETAVVEVVGEIEEI